MLSLSQIIRSKTVWTFILLAIVNGVQSIIPLIHNPQVVTIINSILTILGFFFRIAPTQEVKTATAKEMLNVPPPSGTTV